MVFVCLDPEFHDHPWDNTTVQLSGVVRERTSNSDRLLRPGTTVQRRAEDAHRLEIVEGPSISLFLFGRERRNWGFYTAHGWVAWQDFVKNVTRDRV